MKSTELLQMVWFTASPTPLKASDVYRSLLEDEPDGSQINRNVNPADPVLSTANGLIGDIIIELQVRPGRADLLLRPSISNPAGTEIPTMDLGKAIGLIGERVKNSYKAVESIIRTSLISRLLEKSTNSQDATQRVLNSVKVDIQAPEISDAIFQINSRVSISEELKINRIMRFESASLQTYAVDVRQASQALIPIVKEQSYMVLQLDINTVPLPVPLTEVQLTQAFKSIMDETLRLATAASPQGLHQ